VIAVPDQIVGPLPGGLVLPVSPLLQRQRGDGQPRPPGHDRDQRDDHRQVDQRPVAEDHAAVDPHPGVRITGPDIGVPRDPHQDQQRERYDDEPPQVPDQLAVHQPRPDERREVGRIGHLVRPVDPAAAQPLDPRDDLPHDVVADRRVQRVTRVVEAVVRVELMAVLDPHAPAVGQVQVGLQAQPRAGQLPHRVGRLLVPGQVAVMVADDVDDLAAALGDREQRGAQVLVRAQDVRGRRLAEPEQLDHVAGQHDGQRHAVRCAVSRRQPLDQLLARPPRHAGAERREVQVAGHDDGTARRHAHVEQVSDCWSRRRRHCGPFFPARPPGLGRSPTQSKTRDACSGFEAR
jgi:hypothetical protein